MLINSEDFGNETYVILLNDILRQVMNEEISVNLYWLFTIEASVFTKLRKIEGFILL